MDATTLTNLDIFSTNVGLISPDADSNQRNSCSTTFHKRERQNKDKAMYRTPGTESNIMQVLDSTVTAFGHRLLRKWICFPITAQ